MTVPPPRPSRPQPVLREWLICLALCLVTLAAFLPVRHFGFISYDDCGARGYVKDNLHVQAGFTWESIRWAFTAFHSSNWHPVTWLSHMLDCRLFGLNPAAHHLVNLTFHLANTMLLYGFLRQTTRAVWRSALVAALFALHPLHIQSVAWISERKDVLSAFFFLLTLLAYAKYAERGGRRSEVRGQRSEGRGQRAEGRGQKSEGKHSTSNLQPPTSIETKGVRRSEVGGQKSEVRGPWSVVRGLSSLFPLPSSLFYFLSLACFALGLMSKPMLVTLPFILLLLDYWPLGRFPFSNLRPLTSDLRPPSSALRSPFSALRCSPWRRLLLEKLPFLALAIASVLVTIQAEADSVAPIEYMTLDWRIANALVSYVMYVLQTLWPMHLAVFYPLVKLPFWQAAGSGLLLLLLTVWLFQRRKTAPELLTGWLWFLVMLLPVIGLVQAGTQARADRYTYLPLIGFFIFAVWGLAELAGRPEPEPCSSRREEAPFEIGKVRASSRRLLQGDKPSNARRSAPSTLPSSVAALQRVDNLSVLCSSTAEDGQPSTPLSGWPRARVLCGLAAVLVLTATFVLTRWQLGFWRDSVTLFTRVVELSGPDPSSNMFLGDACLSQSNYPAAADNYKIVLGFAPGVGQVHYRLGFALKAQGKWPEAEAEFAAAVRLDPADRMSGKSLGDVLSAQNKFDEAAAAYANALQYHPGDPLIETAVEVNQRLAGLLEALRTHPTAEDHLNAASVYEWQKNFPVALEHYTAAWRLQPDNPQLLNNYAWLLATCPQKHLRDAPRAVELARHACELVKYEKTVYLGTLAAALAGAGSFDEAIATAQRACQSAQKNGEPALLKVNEALLARYRAHETATQE